MIRLKLSGGRASTAAAGALVAALLFPAAGTARAADCPDPRSYGDKWLVIVATKTNKGDAEKEASRSGACPVEGMRLAGLAPDVFAVIASAHPDRAAALEAVKQVRAKRKDAYVKFAGRACPSDDGVEPSIAGQVESIDDKWDELLTSGFDASESGPWSFNAQFFEN